MRKIIFGFLVVFVTLTGCTDDNKVPYTAAKTTVNHSEYVGAESCKECHQEAYAEWKQSDHFFAMQKATDEFVKADFNTIYSADEIQYRFYKNDTAYFVEITEANKTASFEVAYTFGWHPLQQYLLKTESGKFQTLRATWDTEKNSWFHQSAGTIVEPHDWLSWSKGGQNWNTMCSSCHSTHVKKNYNENTDSFNTTFEEINVACESCHGAGRNHLEALKYKNKETDKSIPDPYENRDLIQQKTQINKCGTCHARRTMLEDLGDPHNDFLHRFIPQTLTTNFYEADGQIDGEDFVYGSFLSSKMYRNHVSCSNCHNSHTGKIKMEGNALCMQCHEPKYDTDSHHFHKSDTEGAQCINCHMDGKIYMGNDYRRDHSFRVPRPDQSAEYQTSNACNSCHKDKDAKWASKAIKTWYGNERVYHFSDDLLPASLLNEESIIHLENLINNDSVPVIIQATAVEYLQFMDSPKAFELVLKSLINPEALIRQNGYASLLSFPEELRVEPGLVGLNDPVKAVRIMAFRTVSSIKVQGLNPAIAKTWNNVNAEYLRYLKGNADFPTGQTLIGEYYQQQGDMNRAISAFQRALKIDSLQISPYTNLAILYSGQNRNAEVKSILLQGVSNFSENPELHYFLGLNEGALGNEVSQLKYLEIAYSLQPENPKYSYNYILMLYNSGKETEAKIEIQKSLMVNNDNQRLKELKVYFDSKK